MSPAYNDFSGQSAERIRALSDGVFAVAMTLLVLEIRLPEAAGTDRALWSELLDLGPSLAAYVLSFTMLGTFWLAQHTLLGLGERSDRTLSWGFLGFLLVVTTLPFSASVLAEHTHLALAVGVYWLNLLLLGAGLAFCTWHLLRARLVADDVRPVLAVFARRILLAQVLYAAAAAVSLVSPPAAIGALAAVQAFFVLSPGRRRRGATRASARRP